MAGLKREYEMCMRREQKPSFALLPLVPLSTIYNLLDGQDLFSCLQVCPEWECLGCNSKIWRGKIIPFKVENSRDFEDYKKYLNFISGFCIIRRNPCALVDSKFEEILKNIPHCRDLRCSYLEISREFDKLANLKHLQKLTCVVNRNDLPMIVTKLKNISDIQKWNLILRNIPTCSAVCPVPKAEIISSLKSLNKLRSLDMRPLQLLLDTESAISVILALSKTVQSWKINFDPDLLSVMLTADNKSEWKVTLQLRGVETATMINSAKNFKTTKLIIHGHSDYVSDVLNTVLLFNLKCLEVFLLDSDPVFINADNFINIEKLHVVGHVPIFHCEILQDVKTLKKLVTLQITHSGSLFQNTYETISEMVALQNLHLNNVRMCQQSVEILSHCDNIKEVRLNCCGIRTVDIIFLVTKLKFLKTLIINRCTNPVNSYRVNVDRIQDICTVHNVTLINYDIIFTNYDFDFIFKRQNCFRQTVDHIPTWYSAFL